MKELDKPFIIPVFIPQAGCPHQCAFCNQFSITGRSGSCLTENDINRQVNEYLNFKRLPRKGSTQIAFFGGNFLGMATHDIRLFLETAQRFITSGRIDSVRFSTRPDTIRKETLDTIAPFSVSTIEIGAQSMDEEVLKLSNRGHSALDTQNALEMLKNCSYSKGVQMMVGLPGDTAEKTMTTTQKIIAMSPDFVRIYPTLVLSNSPLAQSYKNGKYHPLSLGSTVSQVKKVFLEFRKNSIPVIRMGLQPSAELESGGTILAGPYHPSFGHFVYSEIFLDKIVSILNAEKPVPDYLSIQVHTKNLSMVRGMKNHNMTLLKRHHHVSSVNLTGRDDLSLDELIVNNIKAHIYS